MSSVSPSSSSPSTAAPTKTPAPHFPGPSQKDRPPDVSHLTATAKSLESLRQNFVTSASHEFRTPLTVIASSVGILRDFGDSLDPDRRQLHFQRIQRSIQQITQLLDDMLMVNTVEKKALDCKPTQLDVVSWYQTFVEELQQVNCDRDIQLVIDETASPFRSVDEALFRQVLGNLFSNALKYSSPDTLVKTSITLDIHKLSVIISDQGKGIPADEQSQIFQPFFRGSNVGHVAGLGLGLSMAQACTLKHAGTLQVNSIEGIGTEVRLDIPVAAQTV
ncbi:MAG: HAMP domain-containing sensor histidine kinase [Cyanobacteria bacterium P01_A01_bin.105]